MSSSQQAQVSTVLATHETTTQIDRNDVKGTLRCEMHIKRWKAFESVRRLEMDVFLTLDGETEEQNIGELIACFIDKDQKDSANKPVWLRELLIEPDKDVACEEVNMMMELLYTSSGRVRRPFRNYQDELETSRLVFVDGFELKPDWQGRRLGSEIMPMFFSIMDSAYPEDDDAKLVYVLFPARSNSTNFSNGYTDLQVEQRLQAQYERSGFQTWLQGEGTGATVMGRTL